MISKKRKISDSRKADAHLENATETSQREGNIYFLTSEYIQNKKTYT